MVKICDSTLFVITTSYPVGMTMNISRYAAVCREKAKMILKGRDDSDEFDEEILISMLL